MAMTSLKEFFQEFGQALSNAERLGVSIRNPRCKPGWESDWYTVITKIPAAEIDEPSQENVEKARRLFWEYYDNNPDITIREILDDLIDEHLVNHDD